MFIQCQLPTKPENSKTMQVKVPNFGWLRFSNLKQLLGGGFKYFFIFNTYLEKWSNLTNMFQMGWNHQLENNYVLGEVPLIFFEWSFLGLPGRWRCLGMFPMLLQSTPMWISWHGSFSDHVAMVQVPRLFQVALPGIIKLPIWGDQTLQMHGKFEGFSIP